jgi:DNA modification methylase
MILKPSGVPSVLMQVLGRNAVVLALDHPTKMQAWWRSIWTDIKGASTRTGHPAPYPPELAERLIRMFSFAGDTVLDPFTGTGSTNLAAMTAGRNSVGNEIEPTYLKLARQRLKDEAARPRPYGAVNATVS